MPGEGSYNGPVNRPEHVSEPASVSTDLCAHLRGAIAAAGGWLPFDAWMSAALYAPGLGYYSGGGQPFGRLPSDGSDFVTAPLISPRFGRALARQVAQALRATGTGTVVEFGAGTGALAAQLLDGLADEGLPDVHYRIVEVSGPLRARQAQALAAHGARVQWLDHLPERLEAVAVGNEVLDAMPVQLLHFDGACWQERGVAVGPDGGFVFADRPTPLRPPVDARFVPGTVTEIHPQARAFIATLAGVLARGAAFFIDYGFPEAEYWHPQRTGGTLMCHRGHQADADPLADPGAKDITAHVDFTGIALAGQDAGLQVLGYTTQAHFLINCGVLDGLADAPLRERAMVQKLLTEHEMGELFKVIGFSAATTPFDALGFARGDRSHTL